SALSHTFPGLTTYLSPSLALSRCSFHDTPTTEIYTLSLHDALPICARPRPGAGPAGPVPGLQGATGAAGAGPAAAELPGRPAPARGRGAGAAGANLHAGGPSGVLRP